MAGVGQKQLPRAHPHRVQGLSASSIPAGSSCSLHRLKSSSPGFLSHNCGHCLVSAFSVCLTTVSVVSIFGKGANNSRHTVLAAIGTPSQSLVFIPRSLVGLSVSEVCAHQPLSEKAQNKMIRDGAEAVVQGWIAVAVAPWVQCPVGWCGENR